MASTAKSKKNKKGKTVKLNQFLAEGNGAPAPGYALANVHNSWADEVESNEFVDSYASYASSGNRKIYLPTAPKSARDPDVDMSKLPSEPPFKAFLANVPYDVDEKDIEDFFSNLKLKSVRLPREGGGESGRLKGFAYAEFEDKESLLEALTMSNETIKNRPIRIDIAGSQDGDRDRGNRSDDHIDRTPGDWRSAPREEPLGEFNRASERSGGYNDRYSDKYSNNDRDRDFGDSRRNDRDFGDKFQSRDYNDRGQRGGFDRDERDYGSRNSSYNDRSGYGRSGYDRGGFQDRQGYDRNYSADNSRGYGDRNDRGYGGERGYGDRDRYRDDRSYGGGRRDYGSRNDDRRGYDDRSDGPPPPQDDAPKERPKLQLQKRSVPINKDAKSVSSSSIFGSAKPVDTAAKEREVEQRLARMKLDNDRKSLDNYDRDEVRSMPRNSTESGKSRLDSERSQSSDDGHQSSKPSAVRPTSPKRENTRIVPAPPPATNAWSKKPSTNLKDESAHSNEHRGSENSDRRYAKNSDGAVTYHDDEENHRDNRGPSSSARISNRSTENRTPPKQERAIKDPVKYDDPKPQDFTSANKFAHLTAEDTTLESD